MDGKQFDAIIRSLTNESSRRGVLRGVIGGVAGALTGLLALEAVPTDAKRRHGDAKSRKRRKRGDTHTADSPQAKCKGGSRPCAFDTNCCSGRCCNKRCCYPGEFCNGNGQCQPEPPPPPPACPSGQHCSGGRCCDTGFVACPGNPTGCIPESTACSGEPVCCNNNGAGPGIVCGFQGQCQAGSAPPPATCPPAG